MYYFRDNPKLGDGNFIRKYNLCSSVAMDFRDNPKLGDGNLIILVIVKLALMISEITPN